MTFQDVLKEAQALSLEERRELIKSLVDTLTAGNTEGDPELHSIME